jgi:protoheme IX farnesyltransferase
MVLVMTALGYVLGGMGIHSLSGLFYVLLGAGMSCGGAGVLNHFLERDVDRKMNRTKNRPIPSGVIPANRAFLFGVYLVLFGVTLLTWKVNLITAFLALMTAFLYAVVYTPMKRLTWLNTFVGAIPGALPPMGGWAAATGHVEAGAWALFAILFIWQIPHFYAIAWIHREDYNRGGFKMLPSLDPTGVRTMTQSLIFATLLIPVSLLPTWLGISSWVYGVGAFVLGLGMLWSCVYFARSRSVTDARRVLRASIIYLPLLFMLILIDFSIQ